MNECWFRRQGLQASNKPEYLGPGTLSRAEYARCDGRSAAKDPWLIFSRTDGFKPHEIIGLYSRRMLIEQSYRDEKSERFGF